MKRKKVSKSGSRKRRGEEDMGQLVVGQKRTGKEKYSL
jgi:hypothetical protein